MGEQVTSIVRARVLPGRGDAYREANLKISETSRSFPGYLGTRIISPTDADADWVTIYSFDSYENYCRWMESEQRRRCLKTLEGLVEGSVHREQITGLDYWFGPDQKNSWPPSWRMTMVAFLAIFPLSWFIPPTVRQLLPGYPAAATVLSIIAVTLCMSYLSLPLMVHLCRRWL